MGISLAFGVAFATVLTLLLLPCLLVMVNDVRFVIAGGLSGKPVSRRRLEPAFSRGSNTSNSTTQNRERLPQLTAGDIR